MTATILNRFCLGCGIPINALPPDQEICNKQRCKRSQENERRRAILSAFVDTMKEAATGKHPGSCEHSEDRQCSGCFASELLVTLQGVGVA